MRLLDGPIPQPGGSRWRWRLPARPCFEVTADGHFICGHAEVVLLAELPTDWG